MTVMWILINYGPSDVLFTLILEREKNRSTRRKTLEAQERSTAGTLLYETSLTRLGFSGERHNALIACATHASLP